MNESTEPQRCAVVVHGGAEDAKQNEDGCIDAARKAMQMLGDGQHGLAAVIAAVTHLEDDGRFNAGHGASYGMDGKTIELCAAVMDSRGALGAVAAARAVRNPVLLARAVAGTPHWLLAGEGADNFARACGLPMGRNDSARARKEYEEVSAKLMNGEQVLPGVHNESFQRQWNFRTPWHEAVRQFGHGTVGAVARDAQGHFAVATSTGGSVPQLLGRVGDTPIVGCGFYCGPHGAVAISSIAEYLMRDLVAWQVYRWIEEGRPVQESLDEAMERFGRVDLGIIAVGRNGAGSASNKQMPVGIEES